MRAAALSVLLGTMSFAEAASLPVVNAGFEDLTGAPSSFNEFTFGALPPAWTVYDPDSVTNSGLGPTYFIGTLTPQILPAHDAVNYQNFPAGAIEGQRVAIAFNYAAATPGHEYGLQQTLSATLEADTHYTLNVQVGNIASGWSVSGNSFNLDGFPGYRIDLLAGNTVLASDFNSLAGTISEGAWGLSTVTFQTGSTPAQLGQALRIRLVNLNVVDLSNPSTSAADREVDFDAVSLSAVAVPEPATTGLLIGLGALALAYAGRKRR